jgi:hypothetical protein
MSPNVSKNSYLIKPSPCLCIRPAMRSKGGSVWVLEEVNNQLRTPAALSPGKVPSIIHRIAGWMGLGSNLNSWFIYRLVLKRLRQTMLWVGHCRLWHLVTSFSLAQFPIFSASNFPLPLYFVFSPPIYSAGPFTRHLFFGGEGWWGEEKAWRDKVDERGTVEMGLEERGIKERVC